MSFKDVANFLNGERNDCTFDNDATCGSCVTDRHPSISVPCLGLTISASIQAPIATPARLTRIVHHQNPMDSMITNSNPLKNIYVSLAGSSLLQIAHFGL